MTASSEQRDPLPDPKQCWVHACDNKATLMESLVSEEKTAIETDILMGSTFEDAASGLDKTYPIMSHPPARNSDLSMKEFLRLCSQNNNAVSKVIKLDFKELAVVEPTLKEIADLGLTTTETGAIFLNADILPGPGQRREGVVTIPADTFMEACLPHIEKSPARIAFSLGYKTSSEDLDGYTPDDVEAMARIIEKYKLVEKGIGVVLALNARQFAKSISNFDPILERFPGLQILVWTGKGEPQIHQSKFDGLVDYFLAKDRSRRVGFDCQVTKSSMRGMSNEAYVSFIGYMKLIFCAMMLGRK